MQRFGSNTTTFLEVVMSKMIERVQKTKYRSCFQVHKQVIVTKVKCKLLSL